MDLVTFAIALGALALTVSILSSEKSVDDKAEGEKIGDDEWSLANRLGTLIGPADALDTIVEFSDFQCPFCRTMEPILDSLASVNRTVAIRYRQLPLTTIHPQAAVAARYAICAQQQGRFLPFRRQAFSEHFKVSSGDWAALALDAGIRDTLSLGYCESSEFAFKQLAADTADAAQLELDGTPVYFIRGRRYVGSMRGIDLREALEYRNNDSFLSRVRSR